MHRRTIGFVGTGRIDGVTAGILHGFGCRLLGYDSTENKEFSEKYNLRYVDIKELYRESDIISLHIPLTTDANYLINREQIVEMKRGVMLIKTTRGTIMNTQHVIEALENGKIGYLGTDV